MTEPTSGSSVESVQEYDIAGMVVALCSPTYGNVDPSCSKSLRAAVMFAANRGVRWAGDSSPDKMGYGTARNTGVQHTLKTTPEAKGIVWVDSDINMPVSAIARLLDTANHNEFDFVSGIYHQRLNCHSPVFYRWNQDLKSFQPAQDYPPNTIGMADGCGFGFVYTSSKMLRDIALCKSFDLKSGWFPDRRDVGGFGEDLSFCDMAREAGYQLYVDSGVQVLHQGNPQWIGEEDFRKNFDRWIKEASNPVEVEWGVP